MATANNMNLDPVENASATLYEARVLIIATEAFSAEAKKWLELAPFPTDGPKKVLDDLETMLGVLHDHVTKAKGEIDQFVSAATAKASEASA